MVDIAAMKRDLPDYLPTSQLPVPLPVDLAVKQAADLPAWAKREMEFSLSLLRISTPGRMQSAQGAAIERLLCPAQAAERP